MGVHEQDEIKRNRTEQNKTEHGWGWGWCGEERDSVQCMVFTLSANLIEL